MIAFTVYGVAQPAGSKRAFAHKSTGRIVVVDDAKGSRAWKNDVAKIARDHAPAAPLDGPLKLEVLFVLPRAARALRHRPQRRDPQGVRAAVADRQARRYEAAARCRGRADRDRLARRRPSGRPDRREGVRRPGPVRDHRAADRRPTVHPRREERCRMTTATETDLERTVREEQQAHDAFAGEDDEQPDDNTSDSSTSDDVEKQEEAGQTAAFDKSQYDREDLQIAKVDGNTIDRISLKFSGEVFLDRSDPSDVAVYNELRLGRDVEILIEAKCSSTAAKGATDRDGDLDVVVGTKGLKVHSLRKPAGADWVEDAA